MSALPPSVASRSADRSWSSLIDEDSPSGERNHSLMGYSRACHVSPLGVAGSCRYLRVEGVDGLLTLGQHPDRLVVAAQERAGRPGQILGDYGEQLDDLGFYCLKLNAETPADARPRSE